MARGCNLAALSTCITQVALVACSVAPSKFSTLAAERPACRASVFSWDQLSLHGIGPNEASDGVAKVASLNRCVIDFYSLEKRATRDPGQPDAGTEPRSGDRLTPEVCIALSGGGIRSAAFSYGALSALSKIKPLEEVDYLSSVSGGGYLSSALYANLFRSKDESIATLMDPEGAFATHLATHGRTYAALGNLATDALLLPVSVPVYFSTDFLASGAGIFSGGPHIGAVTRTQANLINTSFYRGSSYQHRHSPLLRESLPIEGRKLPFPIFVATVLPKGKYSCEALRDVPIKDHLFELTPLAIGSPSYSYSTREAHTNLILAEASAISAGAIDGANGLSCRLLSSLAQDAGYTIQFSSDTGIVLLRVNPNERLYITDGGFADNLGLVSLVNRSCRKIISVDAEHDPEMRFHALRKAFAHLSAFQGMENPMVDEPPNGDLFSADVVITPVRIFRVGEVPIATPEHGEHARVEIPIELLHIKLSLDKARIDSYRESVRTFYETSARENQAGCRGDGLSQRCRFPQQSTAVQSYSEKEWEAYVDLGRDLVEQNDSTIRSFLKQ